MYEDIVKQRILQEFQNLIEEAKESEINVTEYLDFMRNRILDSYSVN